MDTYQGMLGVCCCIAVPLKIDLWQPIQECYLCSQRHLAGMETWQVLCVAKYPEGMPHITVLKRWTEILQNMVTKAMWACSWRVCQHWTALSSDQSTADVLLLLPELNCQWNFPTWPVCSRCSKTVRSGRRLSQQELNAPAEDVGGA